MKVAIANFFWRFRAGCGGQVIFKYNAKNNPKNNPKNNAKATKRLLVAQQTTHNNLLESTVPVQNVAWTDANPLDRDAAYDKAYDKAVSLVETAKRSNDGS